MSTNVKSPSVFFSLKEILKYSYIFPIILIKFSEAAITYTFKETKIQNYCSLLSAPLLPLGK